MSATKQKSSAGKNVLVFFIVFILLEMLIIFGISKVFKNKDSAPSLAGYTFYITNDENMAPDVPKGTMVVTAECIPSAEKIGKAVLCKNVEGIGTGVFRLSEMTAEAEGQDGVIYKVYQNNDTKKFYNIKSENIVGISTTHLQTAGKVVIFVKSTVGKIICAAVPLFLMIIIEVIIAFATHKPKQKKSYYEEVDDEQEEVELDDFLFGGKDEGEQIAKRRKMRESKEKREGAARPQPAEEVKREEEKIKSEEAKSSDSAVEEKQKDTPHITVDRAYYEKASALVDGRSLPDEKQEKAAEAAKRRKAAKESAKAATSSLEDLMKLMEQEQDKLKKQLSKNQPKQ